MILTLLVSFGCLVHQIKGLTFERGAYDLPRRIILAPGFSVNDNIAYIFDVRGDAGTKAAFKLDLTVPTPSWQEILALPTTSDTAQRDQSCQVGDKIYFYHYSSRSFDIFDTTTDTFIDVSNIPLSPYSQGVSGSVVSDYNNYIYLVGGQAATTSAYVQRYDIANNQWQAYTSTNAPYSKWFWLNAIVYPPQHRIYVFGGYSTDISGDFFDIHYFDLNTNQWSGPNGQIDMVRLEPLVYIAETDRIYIFTNAAVTIYDPNTGTSTVSDNSPNTVCGSSGWSTAMTLNGRLQEFGGTSSGVNCRTTEQIYNPTFTTTPNVDPCSQCGACEECVNEQCVPQDCSDGLYCNGDEYCDLSDGQCKPGAEIDCPYSMVCDNDKQTCVRDCDFFAIDEFLTQCSAEWDEDQQEIANLEIELSILQGTVTTNYNELNGALTSLQSEVTNNYDDVNTKIAAIEEKFVGLKPFSKSAASSGIFNMDSYGNESFEYKDMIICVLLLMNMVTMIISCYICFRYKNNQAYQKVVSFHSSTDDEQQALKR